MVNSLLRQSIKLSRGNAYRTSDVVIDPLTAELTLTITRPTTAAPVKWDGTVQVRVVVTVDGVEYYAEGQATGGIRLGLKDEEIPVYQLIYRPTYSFGIDATEFIKTAQKDAEGFWVDVPMTRCTENASNVTARVELTLRGGLCETEIALDSISAPAPKVRYKNSVAFDAASGATEVAGDGVVSVSHTAAGTNRAVFVGNGSVDNSSTLATTSVTYGGTGMTEKWDVAVLGFSPNYEMNSGYTMVAPATGAQTVTATLNTASPAFQSLGVISMTGVDQTTPVGTANTASGDGGGGAATPSVTVASVGSDDMVADNVWYIWVSDASAGTDQTQRYNTDYGGQRFSRGSTQPGSAGGVMSWTGGTMYNWIIGAIAFKPVSASVVPVLMRQYRARRN